MTAVIAPNQGSSSVELDTHIQDAVDVHPATALAGLHEAVMDVIGAAFWSTPTISVVYADPYDSIGANVVPGSIGPEHLSFEVGEGGGGVTSEDLAAQRALSAGYVIFSNPVTAVRPSGFGGVLWLGPSQPDAYQSGDVWLEYIPPVTAAIDGSLASETDTAFAGILHASGMGGSLAAETDSAFGGSLVSNSPTTINGAQAAETDTAFAGILHASGIGGSLASETDTAFAGVLSTPLNVTPTLVLSELQPADQAAYTTAGSVAIPTGQTTLLSIDAAGPNWANAPTVTQTGVTWELVGSAAGGGVATPAIWLFRCAPGSAVNAPITATFGAGEVKTSCVFTVVTFANSKTGSNGAAALGTPVATLNASGSTISATLAALAGPTSAAFGVFRGNSAQATATLGTGITQLSSETGGAPASRTISMWKQNATLLDLSGVSNVTRLLAVEVKAV